MWVFKIYAFDFEILASTLASLRLCVFPGVAMPVAMNGLGLVVSGGDGATFCSFGARRFLLFAHGRACEPSSYCRLHRTQREDTPGRFIWCRRRRCERSHTGPAVVLPPARARPQVGSGPLKLRALLVIEVLFGAVGRVICFAVFGHFHRDTLRVESMGGKLMRMCMCKRSASPANT